LCFQVPYFRGAEKVYNFVEGRFRGFGSLLWRRPEAEQAPATVVVVRQPDGSLQRIEGRIISDQSEEGNEWAAAEEDRGRTGPRPVEESVSS
jgi:hypothetical protein